MNKQDSRVRPDSSTHRRKRHWVAALCAGLLATTAAFTASSASASLGGNFELDGNVLASQASTPPAAAPDWGTTAAGNNSIFTVDANGLGVKRNPLPTGFFDAGFVRDFVPGNDSDATTFTTGSKDTLDIKNGGWQCGAANHLAGKTAINNAYIAVYNDTTFTPAHLVLYFGMEKPVSNGDNNMAVWMLQDNNVGCVSTGKAADFSGGHVDGDILMTAAFTNGGSNPQIAAYKWDNGALNTTPIATGAACGASATICALASGGTITTPWQTVNGGTQGTTLGADQFYEGAIDLTANNLDHDSNGDPICVNKFIFDTRSSQSLTATLFDYAEGSVHTCGQSSVTTNLYKENGATDISLAAPASHEVTLPADVYDTATVTPGLGSAVGGTVVYQLYTDAACTTLSTAPALSVAAGTVTVGAGGTVPASPTLTFTQPGDYYWQATYTPPAGSRDEGSTSTCTDEPLTVKKAAPTIATTASAGVQVGGNPANTISDTATISNGYFPSGGIAPGNVTFKLYGPFAAGTTLTAASCTADKLLTLSPATVAATRVDNTHATATSTSFTPTSAGLYQWTASYAGNAQNEAAAETACGVTAEQVTVTPRTPTLATTMLLSDRVKVSGVAGAGAPTGTVKFELFPSADCTGTAVYTADNQTIDANGVATTPQSTAVTAGTYSWKVTFTPGAGNVNYSSASTTCTAAQSDEKAVISYAGSSPIAP